MDDEIMVSICCTVYNHEKYIRQALDSFLAQKTNFKYEIIIHDDASTDNTANIIKEYENKYPNIIKPIYQTENQFSKGKKASLICYNHSKGKYIALCEGDDYWIDEQKLQYQVDYMEQNPECTFCFHNAIILYDKSKKKKKFITNELKYKKYRNKDNNYMAGDIHLFGCGVAPTASFLFRKENVSKIPDWLEKCVCGDMPIKLIMTSFGYAHYIDKEMSVYRIQVDNSMTQQWKKQNSTIESKVKHLKKVIQILDNINEFTNEKYQTGLNESKRYYEIEILLAEKKYKEILKFKNFKYYRILTNDLLGIKLIIKMLLKY